MRTGEQSKNSAARRLDRTSGGWGVGRSSLRALILQLALAAAASLLPRPVQAHNPDLPRSEILGAIGFDQRLGATPPLDLQFVDEQGRQVRLGDFFGARPVILIMGYFTCPNLCPLTRQALAQGLREVTFRPGREFDVVAVSIDPQEQVADALQAKQEELATYGRPESAGGWHFLTGDHATIDRLAAAVGFRYAYDSRQGQFAHASGVVVLTPAGVIARYLLGLEFAPRDLRLALVEATEGRIGSAIDQVLLFCYHYDPLTGQYTMLVMNVIRLAGGVTVLLIGGLVVGLLRREQR